MKSITHQTAASAVPLLQEALGRVLQSAALIARVSSREFEAHSDLLTPARLGIYQVLRTVYADYPDLDPLADLRSSTDHAGPEELADSSDAVPETAGPLDPTTCEQAHTILGEAYDLLVQADSLIATANRDGEAERARLRVLCTEALAAIQVAQRELRGQRKTTPSS